MRISLKGTIYAGNTIMLILTLFVCIFTIVNLETLKGDFDGIILRSMPTTETMRKLIDIIHEQVRYEQEFLLNSNAHAEESFIVKGNEFKTLLHLITVEKNMVDEKINTILHFHNEYTAVFAQILDAVENERVQDAQTLSHRSKKLANRIIYLLRKVNRKLISQREQRINEFYKLLDRILLITLIVALSSSIFALTFAFLFSQYIVRCLSRVKELAVSIKKGDFDTVPTIEGSHEFAELSVSFKEMALRLKELEAVSLDANPLTKLPGNLAIEKELILRFKENKTFSFCLLDIDNFKAYSDKYGYSRGSDVLLWLGNLIKNAIENHGKPDDFVGHIGGDDFVVISEPERVRELCQRIITLFDVNVLDFYNEEDRKNRYIISVNRQNQITEFPLMTLSIAIVSNDKVVLTHPKEVAEKIADLKKYAKSFPRSIYVCERRRSRST
jgi:diguanylate cyclase (GGDEF)-like protein